MIICRALCNAHFFKLAGDGFLCFLNGKTGKFLGVYELIALAEIVALFKGFFGNIDMTELFIAVDYLYHINIVCDSIFKVTLVM